MQANISARLLASKASEPTAKAYEIRDERLKGFILRVQPSGARSYYAQIGRSKRVSLGREGELKPDEARDRCEKVLGNVAHGRAPFDGIDGAESETLGDFITNSYSPWLTAHYSEDAANKTLTRLKRYFGKWYTTALTAIAASDIDNWHTKRINEGVTALTADRDLAPLSRVLTRAVKLEKIKVNPARQVDREKVDRSPMVRYLTPAEEGRLRAALAARDAKFQAARESGSKWRKDRKKEAKPPLPHYGDHLTPAVLVSMNTGLRRGELLALKWSEVDFKGSQLTLPGSITKSGQTRYVPMNAEAVETLKKWKEQAPDDGRVFPIDTGFKTAWAALLERAKITEFRWHDLRHHFASRLAQAGVPLNTIRDLLGHQSLAMVLRYAHLAPDQRADAVAKLMEART